MSKIKEPEKQGYKLVFAKYIIRNGVKIYPKSSKAFSFWVPADKAG